MRPPLPLRHACALAGVPEKTLRDVMATEADVAVTIDRARADGLDLCLREAVRDPAGGRAWTWLAERLYPREMHLPTKITGVSAEDGGAPIATAVLSVTLADAVAGAREDYTGSYPALPKGGR